AAPVPTGLAGPAGRAVPAGNIAAGIAGTEPGGNRAAGSRSGSRCTRRTARRRHVRAGPAGAEGSLYRGRRLAVRTPGRSHGSSFPALLYVRLDVEELQAH